MTGKPGVQLDPAVAERLNALGRVDLVVGIPSFNNARTITHVVRAAAVGLAKHFPDQRAVIVNSDGGSRDGTPEIVGAADAISEHTLLVSHKLNPVHKIITPYHGIPGKGSAFRTIFAIAQRLEARALAVIDSDLRSITPEWIELLLGPVLLKGHDYVAPMYLRHKYDGTITNSIIYPLTRALYGKDVRQPIGGEFGLSGRLAAHLLEKPVWETDVARFGIDIWMTTTAIADGFSVCQSFLGAKIHDAKDPGADLTTMFVQVVSAVFDLMTTYERTWRSVTSVEPVPLFGFPYGVGLEPVQVNPARMLALFRQAYRDLAEVWRMVLTRSALDGLAQVAVIADDAFTFSDRLWVRIVYEFAAAHRRGALPKDQLLASLVPLYLGRTAAFVRRTATAGAEETERSVHALAEEFLSSRDYLIECWNAKH
jgi:glucosylglycerate synthase